MFTSTLLGHWIPLTWLTLALDHRLWGMDPFGYHLTSLLFHAINAALFYVLARRILALAAPAAREPARAPGAAVAALFFALHPLRAESVAWVTERRDVVSTFFALLCVLAYLRMVDARPEARRKWLALSVACYVLAMLSKSIVMTLPAILVVLDVWPLRRRAWLEKLPYVVVAVAGAGVALFAQWTSGLLTSVERYPLGARLAMAGYSLVFYVARSVVPSGLIPQYEVPRRVHLTDPVFLACEVVVVAFAVATWLVRRRWPAIVAASVAYAVMLAPVSDVLHTGHQIVADRYSYLSCLPWALLLGGGLVIAIEATSRGGLDSRVGWTLGGISAVWLLGLGVLTWNQVQIWKDTETLWRYAVDVDPRCALCHNQLGAELGNRGLLEPAIAEFERAIAIRPDDPGLRGNLALALIRVNRLDDALMQLRVARDLRPRDAALRDRIGSVLIRQGRFDEASAELHEALSIDPDHAGALADLAVATHALGRPDEARRYLQRAVALEPGAAARLDPRFVGALLGPTGREAPPAR